MPGPQDSSHPLHPVLETLKSRFVREKVVEQPWREIPDELSAEDYPELPFMAEKRKPSPQKEPEIELAEVRLRGLLQEGRLRTMDAGQIRQVFLEMLQEGVLECFIQAIDQVHAAMESRTPEDRRWALESVRALLSLDDLNLIPYGTLPLLLDCVGNVLAQEERAELRDAALESMATMLGIEVAQGELDGIHAQIAWLGRKTGSRGAECIARILASRQLVLPSLALFFKEGHGVLEGRVLPFFRSIGEPGARTLMGLLDEERNRQHRNRILELLKLLGPMSVPALKEGLVAGSWHLVRNALNLAGDLEDPQTFEYVVPCLDHSDTRVVHPAIRALWKTGGARAESYLLAMLPRAEAGTQAEILQGLSHVGTAAAIAPIGALAESGPEEVRIRALDTLALLRLPETVPLLDRQLRRQGRIFKTSEPMAVRLAAARALASIGTLEARRVLEEVVAAEPRGPGREALRKVREGLDSLA